MKTETKEKVPADNLLNNIILEIDGHNEALEILISNTNFDRKQIESLRKFAIDEETSLRAKIKLFSDHYGQQISNHELIKVSEHSPLFPTYLRIRRELIKDLEVLVLSEIALFKKKIAQFILLLEI